MKIPELLAPAGSYETLIAVCNAGADAVYAGGTKYGARAYADNFTEEELLEAISYVHLHGKKLYLTLNTLIKDSELDELYDYLLPLYVKGLDGIIVQDLGVIDYLKRQFPELPIHVSTQAAVMGEDSLEFFKKTGAVRAVLARELSLKEIKELKEKSDIELEIFVHGALCYSYSGMCFYSSLIGGRSGNRGRCAQPCRMNYSINNNNRDWMSLKDLSVLESLDKLCEIGVDSLKIEGRMKNTGYAAGVTKIYRKYLDIIKSGCKDYNVSDCDLEFLNKLYQRRGFSDGYLYKHNGKDMLIDESKRRFEEHDDLNHENIVKKKIPVDFNAFFSLDQQAVLVINDDNGNVVTAYGDVCTEAAKKPLTKDTVQEKLSRVNDSPVELNSINIEISGDLFLPLSSLNSLRRDAVEMYLKAVEEKYIRKIPEKIHIYKVSYKDKEPADLLYSASFLDFEQGYALSESDLIRRVYYPFDLYYSDYEESVLLIERFKSRNKKVYLSMPEIFRSRTRKVFMTNIDEIMTVFDGFLLKNIDELYFMHHYYRNAACILDFTIYAFNRNSLDVLKEYYDALTAPIELNVHELKNQDLCGKELIIYGRYPMMFSANCLIKNSSKCTASGDVLKFKDRKGFEFFVKANCSACYNTVYNTKYTSLLGVMDQVKQLNVSSYRFSFTDEKAEEISNLLDGLKDPKDFTRGHFIRGVQ